MCYSCLNNRKNVSALFPAIINGKPLHHRLILLLRLLLLHVLLLSCRSPMYCTICSTASAFYILANFSSIYISIGIPDKEQNAGCKTNPRYCQRRFSSAVKLAVLTKSGHTLYKWLDCKKDRLTVSCEVPSNWSGEQCGCATCECQLYWRTALVNSVVVPHVSASCTDELLWWTVWLCHMWVPVVLKNLSGELCDWCHMWVPVVLTNWPGEQCGCATCECQLSWRTGMVNCVIVVIFECLLSLMGSWRIFSSPHSRMQY
jgi:hypothetical protein